jgi:hypothetical protein
LSKATPNPQKNGAGIDKIIRIFGHDLTSTT